MRDPMIYAKYIKRMMDLLLSTIALIILSPIILLLIIIGMIAVKGNPFFTQNRPGLNEKVFKLLKFRTMTNEKDENGGLLPDDIRLISFPVFPNSLSRTTCLRISLSPSLPTFLKSIYSIFSILPHLPYLS